GVVERLIGPVVKSAKSAGSLVGSTVGAGLATNLVTADQFIAIVLPGRMVNSAFENRRFAPLRLSRTIAPSGTRTGALIPWNSCGASLAAILGLLTVSFLPYAVFNFASPLLATAFAYLGVRMMRVAGTQKQTPPPRKAAGGDAGEKAPTPPGRMERKNRPFVLSFPARCRGGRGEVVALVVLFL